MGYISVEMTVFSIKLKKVLINDIRRNSSG